MKFERRDFLKTAGLVTVAGIIPGLISCEDSPSEKQEQETATPGKTVAGSREAGTGSWEGIRGNFVLDPEYIHMAGLLLSSHPEPVREAISEFRRNLNENPANYVENYFGKFPAQVRMPQQIIWAWNRMKLR